MRSAELTATRIGAEEVPRLIDELPLVALAAGMARGETVVRGAAELRVKGNGPDRNSDNFAERPWRAHLGER